MNEREGEGQEAIRPGLLIVLMLAVVGAVYAPALGGGYMFDDRYIVLGSPLVEHLRGPADYFLRPFFTDNAGAALSHAYYRPLSILSFALDFTLHSGNATALHLTNIALHLVNCALFYAWLRQRAVGAYSALAVAAIWGLHPRLSEAVAWISGRTDVLAATFVLLSLVVWRPATSRRMLASLLVVCGLLSKETALAGAVALVAEEWSHARAAGQGTLIRRWLSALLPLAGALVAYAALRLYAVGLRSEPTSLGALKRGAAFFEALGRYGFALVDPFQPDAIQGRLGRPVVAFVIAGMVLVVALVAAALRFRSHWRRETMAPLALFAVSLGLSLHVVPIPSRMVSADRFLYLPLLGLLAWLAPALERAWLRLPWARLLATVLILGFGVTTFRRAELWADELDFWVREFRRSSEVTRYVSAVELSAVFYRTGRYAAGLALSRQAKLSGESNPEGAEYNAALCLARLGRTEDARAALETLRKSDRRSGAYVVDLALLDLQELRFETATQRLGRALAIHPTKRLQQLLSSIAELEKIVGRLSDPLHSAGAEGLFLRATLATKVARIDESIELWQEVLGVAHEAETARFALTQLIDVGDPDVIARATRLFAGRFGQVPPELANAAEVRRADLEKAMAAERALGL